MRTLSRCGLQNVASTGVDQFGTSRVCEHINARLLVAASDANQKYRRVRHEAEFSRYLFEGPISLLLDANDWYSTDYNHGRPPTGHAEYQRADRYNRHMSIDKPPTSAAPGISSVSQRQERMGIARPQRPREHQSLEA